MPNINFLSGLPIMLDGQGQLVEMVEEINGVAALPDGVIGQILVKKTNTDYDFEWLGQGEEGQVLVSAGSGVAPTWSEPTVTGFSAVKSYFMSGW